MWNGYTSIRRRRRRKRKESSSFYQGSSDTYEL
jgi:hypothetical protein